MEVEEEYKKMIGEQLTQGLPKVPQEEVVVVEQPSKGFIT
jgi:hypothetical protein